MRINDMNYNLLPYKNQQNRTNIVSNTRKSSSSADVTISTRGREISEALKSEQTQRQNRIQELKQQVATGNYRIDSSKVAENLIGFWKNNS